MQLVRNSSEVCTEKSSGLVIMLRSTLCDQDTKGKWQSQTSITTRSANTLSCLALIFTNTLFSLHVKKNPNVLLLQCVCGPHSQFCPYCWNSLLEFYKLIPNQLVTTQVHALNHRNFILEVLNDTYSFLIPP